MTSPAKGLDLLDNFTVWVIQGRHSPVHAVLSTASPHGIEVDCSRVVQSVIAPCTKLGVLISSLALCPRRSAETGPAKEGNLLYLELSLACGKI